MSQAEPVRLAIIGVGLIGGSLGLCLKQAMGKDIYITGLCRTQASMDKAVELGAVDFADSDIEKVVSEADIVFLSPPVLQIVPMVKKLLPYLKPGTIITDAGSTKQYIWQQLQGILPEDIYYIAGHPMTGREKSGVTAVKADLFQGKAYVIVEDTGAPEAAHEKLMSVLRHTGANFTTLDLRKHDRCASVISHVLHQAHRWRLQGHHPHRLLQCGYVGGHLHDQRRGHRRSPARPPVYPGRGHHGHRRPRPPGHT